MNEFKLKDLLEIKNGKDYKHLKDGDIPVYGSGGLMRYVNESIFHGESILLPRKGTLSNIQYVNESFWTVDTIYYSIIDKDKADPYYLYYYLKLLDLSHLNTGTGVPSMTFGAYYDVPVYLPTLIVQKTVSKFLSDLDAKIELNNKINAELEAMAKLIYDYWFVQFDFPDKNGKPYKSSGGKMVYNEELKREIPEGWEVKSLEGITKRVCVGFVGKCQPYYCSKEEGVALIRTGNLSPMGMNFDGLIYVNNEFHDKNVKSQLSYGDILVARHGDSGLSSIYYKKEPANCLNVVVVKPDNSSVFSSEFLYQTLKSESCSKQIKGTSGGSVQGVVNTKSISGVKICLPMNEDVQLEMNMKLKSIYEKIFNNKNQNAKLADLRDWLLPMLMNGQVKVK